MRQALIDAAAAEERGAEEKARWDVRSDKITKFTLELTQLNYLPAGGQGAASGEQAHITAVAAGCRNLAGTLGLSDPAKLQALEQQLLALFVGIQADAAKVPPPPPPLPTVPGTAVGAAPTALQPGTAGDPSQPQHPGGPSQQQLQQRELELQNLPQQRILEEQNRVLLQKIADANQKAEAEKAEQQRQAGSTTAAQ